ncbi:MAG: hypothetical protein U0175_23985 [Caldilineaceae bacterium]
MAQQEWLIGIDDTDNLESRGTGHRVRMLGEQLASANLADVRGITRHQLLVDPRIPYTSHNSSACMQILADEAASDEIYAFCREFLLQESAPGSDAGLCMAQRSAVDEAVVAFGLLAKTQVLTIQVAQQLAQSRAIRLEGLTGTGGGMIGALAAIGLRVEGNDGRFLWLPRLRQLQGIYTVERLCQLVPIELIQDRGGSPIPGHERIEIGEWPRPIMRNGKILLLVDKAENHDQFEWQVADKQSIKQLSE